MNPCPYYWQTGRGKYACEVYLDMVEAAEAREEKRLQELAAAKAKLAKALAAAEEKQKSIANPNVCTQFNTSYFTNNLPR